MITTPIMNPYKREKQIYILLIIFMLALGGVFGTLKTRELLAQKENIRVIETHAAKLQNESAEIQKVLEETTKNTEPEQTAYEKIAFTILPESEQYIELTKTLDNFFEKNFQLESNIIASNLRFGAPEKNSNKPYSALPFSLTITASREKFEKFLNFVETSGSFESQDRMLAIQTIRVNFGDEDKNGEVSFTVDMRAYFRDPKDRQAPN